jgi:hypothetical protein
MSRQAAKRVSKVDGLLPGEQVLDAAFTMGRLALGMADMVGGPDYVGTVDTAEGSQGGRGMAEPIGRHNALVAVTDRRLLYCEVKTALFKPKDIDAAFLLGDVADLSAEKETLTITFRDGSRAAVYATKRESGPLVETFRSLRGPVSPE